MLGHNHPVYSNMTEYYDQEQELIMYVVKRLIIISTNGVLGICYLKLNNVQASEQLSHIEYHLAMHNSNNNNINSLSQVQAQSIPIITMKQKDEWIRKI